MAPIVNCPECGEEYLSTTLECADCRVPLVAHPVQRAAPAPQDELPPASELVSVRAASLGVVQGLSEALAEAGITHRLEALPDDDPRTVQSRRTGLLPYAVYVRDQDAERALAVDRAFMRTIIPDLPEASGEVSEGGCPACGAPVTGDATECSDCGLALIDAE